LIEGSRFDFDNDQGSEEEIEIRYEDKENEKKLEKNPKQQEEVNRQQSEDGCDEWYVEDKGASNPNIVAYKRRYEAMEISHYESVDICEIAWYKIIGVSMSMYVLYKSNNKRGCWFLPHGNKGTHKLQISTNQT